MTTPVWQPGATYPPGSLVVPTSAAPIVTTALVNQNFASGTLSGWNASAGTWTVEIGTGYTSGTNSVVCSGVGIGTLDKTDVSPVVPGQQITASVFGSITNAGTDDLAFNIIIEWADSSHVILPGASFGNQVGPGPGGHWVQSTVTGTAPVNAAYAFIRLYSTGSNHGATVNFSNASWTYVSQVRSAGLVYKATQAAPGKSGANEPVWPNTAGVSVTDNQVTWMGEIGSLVTWTASPLLLSGATEPVWPLLPGAAVPDGAAPSTINWVAKTGQITDANCPQSAVVVIAAGKVFAADNDTIRYSATVNPTDWSSANNAGFLPFGLQTYGSNPVAAMNLYRSNLMAFNSEGSQMWQLDPDPANITLRDSLPIASTHNHALQPVANDLIFLSSRGVRSIGIADSSTSLEAGDIGMPIDPLVQAAMSAAPTGVFTASTFVPALGQYWIAFENSDGLTSTVFVYTIPAVGATGTWSRYVLPFTIQQFTVMNDVLYIRSSDDVLFYDTTTSNDYNADTATPSRSVAFPATVQTPWLDMGNPGVNKMVTGFDFVSTGGPPSVSFGYDQANVGLYTPPFVIPADTVPGQVIPMPICAPSLSMKITYAGGAPWQIQAMNIYVQDERETS